MATFGRLKPRRWYNVFVDGKKVHRLRSNEDGEIEWPMPDQGTVEMRRAVLIHDKDLIEESIAANREFIRAYEGDLKFTAAYESAQNAVEAEENR